MLCAALDAAGLPRARIGLGDAGLYRGLLEGMGVGADGARRACCAALERHDFVELERARRRARRSTPSAGGRWSRCRSCAAGPR